MEFSHIHTYLSTISEYIDDAPLIVNDLSDAYNHLSLNDPKTFEHYRNCEYELKDADNNIAKFLSIVTNKQWKIVLRLNSDREMLNKIDKVICNQRMQLLKKLDLITFIGNQYGRVSDMPRKTLSEVKRTVSEKKEARAPRNDDHKNRRDYGNIN